jgi:hypothetical protein
MCTLGATRTVNAALKSLADVQRELGMDEGFGGGLEMLGNPQTFNDLLDNLCHCASRTHSGPTVYQCPWQQQFMHC